MPAEAITQVLLSLVSLSALVYALWSHDEPWAGLTPAASRRMGMEAPTGTRVEVKGPALHAA